MSKLKHKLDFLLFFLYTLPFLQAELWPSTTHEPLLLQQPWHPRQMCHALPVQSFKPSGTATEHKPEPHAGACVCVCVCVCVCAHALYHVSCAVALCWCWWVPAKTADISPTFVQLLCNCFSCLQPCVSSHEGGDDIWHETLEAPEKAAYISPAFLTFVSLTFVQLLLFLFAAVRVQP